LPADDRTRKDHYVKKPHATSGRAIGLLLSCCFAAALPVKGADLVHAKDGSGVYGYKDTPILPWCGYHVHDPDRPAPKRITPGRNGTPTRAGTAPSDALALFDGKDLTQWQPSEWKVVDGYLEAVGGSQLTTKESFGDFQLHLEWRAPAPPSGEWYNRGNNGVYIMGLYEIQIFDSYTEKLYPDGQAAAIYGQTPPLVNASRKPGDWQSFDIIFTAPVFEGDRLVEPARVTLLHNGVLTHLNEEIRGETGHRVLPAYRKKVSRGPLVLGGHHCPVRFRNIWIRPLDRK
jgi:hypothetical protein